VTVPSSQIRSNIRYNYRLIVCYTDVRLLVVDKPYSACFRTTKALPFCPPLLGLAVGCYPCFSFYKYVHRRQSEIDLFLPSTELSLTSKKKGLMQKETVIDRSRTQVEQKNHPGAGYKKLEGLLGRQCTVIDLRQIHLFPCH
jgi:hypothetical protein